MDNLREHNTLGIIIFNILIIAAILIGVLAVDMHQSHAAERQAYHEAIRITTKKEFDQALKHDCIVLVTTKLTAKDPVSADQNLNKDDLIYYEKSHLITTTIMVPMSDGKNTTMTPQTQTQIVEDDQRTTKSVMIFGHNYSINKFKINKLKQTKSAGGYDYEFVPSGKTVTFLARTKDGTLQPITNSKYIKLYPYTQQQFDNHMKK